ncbi:MAG TPA: hypothetical protein VMW25_01780 [Clostridia bacterium]|nr:hypothetical protein [Clostridia bacterium]
MRKLENTYFFVLGTNHSLSKADIINVFWREKINFEIVAASEEILLVKAQELAVDSFMPELGSAAKMGEIFASLPKENFLESLVEEVGKKEFQDFFFPQELTSIRFGTSVYGAGGKFKDLNKVFYLLPRLNRRVKERLEGLEFNVNYLPPKERELSSVTVHQRELLQKGFELVLGVGETEVYLGKTLAIQDYEGYSLRDFGRPARDPKAGMIPPKLAKIMINLAQKDKKSLFLDPFVGSGTILQELILLGYQDLIGADEKEKAIKDTEINLAWLFEKFAPSKRDDYKISLVKTKIEQLSENIAPQSVDAIVTEPYLGSARVKSFPPEKIKREASSLEALYLKAFGQFSLVLKKEGVVVIVFPVFRFKVRFFHLEILKEVENLGFRNRGFLPGEAKGLEQLKLNLTKRNSIIYFRPGQTVSREIFVFVKT